MIYLDYNATTPLAKEVVDSINDCLVNCWANPSSNYDEGKDANNLIQKSRQSIANMINANTSKEIVFTSGGTESNNWVISSAVKHYHKTKTDDRKPHIITTNIEHDSIREPLEQLVFESNLETGTDVIFVTVKKKTGCVSADEIINTVKAQTCLITVMLANNETGVIQPVREIGQKLVKLNLLRVQSGLPKVLFHTDAAQALGKIPVDVRDLNVDYLTIVGHKFYGPRIGALYRRTGCPLYPLFFGGGQEKRLRPGTENTPMIVGLGTAAELVTKNIDDYNKHFTELQTYFETELTAKIRNRIQRDNYPRVLINCCESPLGRLPNTSSVTFRLYETLNILQMLALAPDLRASLGAACHSQIYQDGIPSRILLASGVEPDMALKTIRFSTGRETTKEDIDCAIEQLIKAFRKVQCDI